ncbi:MAG: hypothetical protein R3B45_13895 [Bdellovibrionota bacterium]
MKSVRKILKKYLLGFFALNFNKFLRFSKEGLVPFGMRASLFCCVLISFTSCKRFSDNNMTKAQNTGSQGVKRMKVALGYAGMRIKGDGLSGFRFSNSANNIPVSSIAVFDLNGSLLSGIKVRRLDMIASYGSVSVNNQIVQLVADKKSFPRYSIELEAGDYYCVSLDNIGTLALGAVGDLACYDKNASQGEFVANCTKSDAMGRVYLGQSDNPVCISSFPVATQKNNNGQIVTFNGKRYENGDQSIQLDYNNANHREAIKYLWVYRKLQAVCDNPGSSNMSLSTSASTGVIGNSAVRLSNLSYCQCQSANLSSRNSYDLSYMAEKIYRNVSRAQDGESRLTAVIKDFSNSCLTGIPFILAVPLDGSDEEKLTAKNEQICDRLSRSNLARSQGDYCICNANNSSSISSSGNINVAFNQATDSFLGQCLRFATGGSTEQFCKSQSSLIFSAATTTADGKEINEGCSACPGAISGSAVLPRKDGESISDYALRCLDIYIQ